MTVSMTSTGPRGEVSETSPIVPTAGANPACHSMSCNAFDLKALRLG